MEKNVIERIEEIYPALSKTQKRIADALIQKGDMVAFLSIQEFCALIGVTSVTVMRFSHKLGYSGYAELKKNLQIYYQNRIYPHVFKYEKAVKENAGNDLNKKLEHTMEAEAQLLISTFQELKPDTIIQAASRLCNAHKIFLVGFGLLLPVVKIFEHRLTTLHRDNIILTFENYSLIPSLIDQAVPEDVFVIFTFPNYLTTIKGIARCAKNKGCQVICITDKPTAPAAVHADLLLLCKANGEIFNLSVTAAISMVNIISTAMVSQMGEPEIESGDTIEQLSEFGSPIRYWDENTVVLKSK